MSQHGCPERLPNMSMGFQEEGQSQPTMEVLVETLTGSAFEMTVSPSDTIFAIKLRIFRVEGIPVSQQHLLYNLKELDDSSSLREHSISDGARLRLVLGMRGGPISTRRLPPPPIAEPWRDIERLLESNRDDADWCNGNKVTVLVFRDGERVNMVRVRENRDGCYCPVDHKYSSSLTHLVEVEADDGLGECVQENALTMGKMLELRRRMDSVSRRRAQRSDKPEIQKTRSEETLSVPSLLDEAAADPFKSRPYVPFDEDSFSILYDGNYTRYDYDCSFTDRYTLLPPIGSRSDSDQSIPEDSDRIKLSDALAGSILVKGREDEAAILEECLEGVSECHIGQDSPQLSAENLAPIPTADYGPLVCGSARWSRARAFGSSSALSGAPVAPAPTQPLPHRLADAYFSSSTSDLEQLTRNRLLPALSRHRNTEHLHLSDEGLHRPNNLEVGSERRHRKIEKIAELTATRHNQAGKEEVPKEEEKKEEIKEKKIRIRCGFCKKRLSIATVHKCRCGAEFCAPHRYAEVHGCAYDYKANAQTYLQRANPLVSAPKLPKI